MLFKQTINFTLHLLFFNQMKFVKWPFKAAGIWYFLQQRELCSLINKDGVAKRWHLPHFLTKASKSSRLVSKCLNVLYIQLLKFISLEKLYLYEKPILQVTTAGSFDKDCELGIFTEIWFKPGGNDQEPNPGKLIISTLIQQQQISGTS